MKTIVIGLDGANWDLLEPWIKNGDLPNLKYLKENGSWGVSKSQLPAVTCPNWKCYSTGKNPAKLGVFWWQRVDREKKKIVGYDSRSFKSLEIFDYMSQAGLRVGVINMPTTYPPKRLNGFMISGAPDSGYTRYTYPESLEKDLKEEYEYRIYPKGHIASRKDIEAYYEDILYLIGLRFKVARDSLRNVDFLNVSIFYINMLHHFLFNNDYVRRAWKCIDRNIGEFIKENHNIILMSDHGTNEVDMTFFLNTWLENEGYLSIKKSYLGNLPKTGITKQRVLRFTNKLGLTNWIKRAFPEKLKRSIPSEDGTMSGTIVLENQIDWDRTKAVGVGQGLIYLLVPKESDEYEKLRDRLIERIRKLKTKTGHKVAKEVYKKEEIYTGAYLDLAPDIVFEEGERVYTSTGIGKEKYLDKPEKWKAENNRKGIFLSYGKEIKKGKRIEDVKIVDLAPTILHIMNVPIPEDIDGRVLKEIFEEDSKLAKKEEHGVITEKERIVKKIKKL